MDLDPNSSEFTKRMKDMAQRHIGIAGDNAARNAIKWAQIGNLNEEEKTRENVVKETRSYEIDTRRTAQISDDLDSEESQVAKEAAEASEETIAGIQTSEELLNAYNEIKDLPYDLDSEEADNLRWSAMRVYKRVGERKGPVDIEALEAKMAENEGSDYAHDVFAMFKEMQLHIRKERKKRRRALNAQHKALFGQLKSQEINPTRIDIAREQVAKEYLDKLRKTRRPVYLDHLPTTVERISIEPREDDYLTSYWQMGVRLTRPSTGNRRRDVMDRFGLHEVRTSFPIDISTARHAIPTSTNYAISQHMLQWVDQNHSEEVIKRARRQIEEDYYDSLRSRTQRLEEINNWLPEEDPGSSINAVFHSIHEKLLNAGNGMMRYSPYSYVGTEYKATTRDFIQYLGDNDKLYDLADKLGLDTADTVLAHAGKEADRDPFFGHGVLDILSNLEQIKEDNFGIGPLVYITTPEFEENYKRLFGTTSKMTMRLEAINPLYDIEGGSPTGAIGTFTTPGELSSEERTNQLAAYLLPRTQEEWGDDLKELDMNGRLSLEARETAVAKAREYLDAGYGQHTITSELRSESISPPSRDITGLIGSFLDTQDFASDEEEAHSINKIYDDLKGRDRQVRLKPVENGAALDKVQAIKNASVARVSLPDLAGLGGSGPRNTVSFDRMAQNLQALVGQQFTPHSMVASIFDTSFHPLDIDGTRLGSEFFADAISDLDAELQSQFPDLSLDIVKQINQVFRKSIDLSKAGASDHDLGVIRDILGLGEDENWINSPLARYSKVLPSGEGSIQGGLTLQALFNKMVAHSKLTRADLQAQFPDIVGGFDQTASLEDIMEGISKVGGPELRPSIYRKVLAQHIGKKATALLRPEIRGHLGSNLSSEAGTRLEEIDRTMRGEKGKAKEVEDIIEHARPDYTRIWDHPIKQFQRLWHSSRLAKAGIVAGTGFIAAGLIDGRIAKDRTKEDMQGPAYLPGGNPYQDTPMYGPTVGGGTMQPSLPQSNGGMEYNVRATGNIDPKSFQTSVSALLGTTNISGSSYDYPQSAGADNNDDIYNMYSS